MTKKRELLGYHTIAATEEGAEEDEEGEKLT